MARRILVAEDSPTQAEYLRLVLERQGYQVDVAANGREALQSIRSAPPDLILSDVLMPEVDGFAFCRAVKSAEATRWIPFILLTHLDTPVSIAIGLEHGADDFIAKPFEEGYLLERVQRIFEAGAPRRDGSTEGPDKVLARASFLLTERERALRDARDFLEHLIAATPGIVFEGDVRHFSLRYISPNVERLLGYTPAEALQAPRFLLFRGIHPEDRERVLREYQQLLGERAVQAETECRFLSKQGDYRWLHAVLRLERNEAGDPMSLLGHVLDITDRKQAEGELREREALLAAANRELEAFSYSVSHDLRAPLLAIDGFSQILLEDCAEQMDDTGIHYLQRIRAGTERMGQLIDDLLSFSRLARSEIYSETVDLSALARTVAAELREREPEAQAEFVIAENVVATGDKRLLRVVLENLLGNALKFSCKRVPARIEFGVERHAGQVAYFVQDNGVGFEMAYADKLFKPFQRLHSVREFPGTGIGLATVQRIIHRHGGRVWAQGAVDQGATIYFTLARGAHCEQADHPAGGRQPRP